MSSSEDYFLTLKTPRDRIALSFGTDVNTGPREALYVADSDLGTLAAIVKLLVDQGVVTDTQVQNAITAASSGTDGSVWTDLVTPSTGLTFNDFEGEDFESGSASSDCTAANTSFGRGQVGDSLLPSLGTITFAASTHNGTQTGKTHTSGGWSRALRTDTYTTTSTAYSRFYFKASAAPGTSYCRLFAYQLNPNAGTDNGADVWSLELAVDASGHPTMIDGGTRRDPTSPPNICNNAWWRVEVGLYGATCECRLYTGANEQGTTPDFSWTAAYASGGVNSALVGQPRSQLTSVQSWDTWHDQVLFATATWPPPF